MYNTKVNNYNNLHHGPWGVFLCDNAKNNNKYQGAVILYHLLMITYIP